MKIKTSSLFCICFLILTQNIFSQKKTSDEYWDAYGVAIKHYDNAEYEKASKAFQIVWTKPNDDEMANHRLYAAAANCMIDNEEGVKENLFKIIPIATKDDIRRVLVSYEIFNKYKNQDWWKDLDAQLNQRLANLIAHHKNLKIFQKGRNIIYSAIRINSNGDTVANTIIKLIPDGTGWGDEAASLQSQVILEYQYSNLDSVEHINELDSIVGKKFWLKRDTTGVIENSKRVWMHPFRNNEFFKTEIAPFPAIKLPLSDSLMQTIKVSTMIMRNWGTYSRTETKERYKYLGKEIKNYKDVGEIDCHKLKGIGDNTRHGLSILDFYFNEDFGFTEMNYTTYDGDKIEFKIIEIEYINQSK